jgi:hypothetical protein
MRAIQIFQSRYSDHQEFGEQASLLEISICGRYAVTYWEDVNDRHVKVLDISPADK